jgi:hypothetical protein
VLLGIVHLRQRDARARIVGIQRERLPKSGACAVAIAQGGESQSQMCQHKRIARLDGQIFLVLAPRPVEILLLQEDEPQILMEIGVVGIHLQRPFKLGDRRLEPPLLRKRKGQQVAGVHDIGRIEVAQVNIGLQGRDGRLKLPASVERGAQRKLRLGNLGHGARLCGQRSTEVCSRATFDA